MLQAQYSLQEYLDAGAQLVPSPEIAAVMPNADLSGAVVEMVKGSPLLAAPLETSRTLENAIGMPVTIGPSVGEPIELTRQNDATPWWGGGAIANAQGDDYCSIGVPVIRNGNNRLLGARHCFYANGVGSTVRDGVGDSLGTVTNADKDGDTVLITPDSGDTSGYVYGGDWNATSSDSDYFFSITGAANPAEDANICTSGAVTGQHCKVTAQNTGKVFDCAIQLGGTCTGFEARHEDAGGVAVGGGDSGGPVYHKFGDGTVGIRGIISNTTAAGQSCGSTSVPTTCYRWVNAVNIHLLLNQWDATIQTSS